MATAGRSQSVKKKRFLVNSYCDDIQETFLDAVMAYDDQEAMQKINDARTYAVAVHAQTYEVNLRYAKKLMKETPARVEREYAKLLKACARKVCPECKKEIIDKDDDSCLSCDKKEKAASES